MLSFRYRYCPGRRSVRDRLVTVLAFLSAAVVVLVPNALTAAGPASPIGCDTPPSRVLRLHVIDEAGAGPETLDDAALEAAAIWAASGLRLTWTPAPRPVDFSDTRAVFVIVRHGLQRRVTGRTSGTHTPVLGQVPMLENGHPGNLIEVSLEAITALVKSGSYMGKPLAELPDFIPRRLLGRAVGRVVAHEIGHWLAGPGHVEDGLMKPRFRASDLVEWQAPRLPRAWTSMGGGTLTAWSSRCEPPVHGV